MVGAGSVAPAASPATPWRSATRPTRPAGRACADGPWPIGLSVNTIVDGSLRPNQAAARISSHSSSKEVARARSPSQRLAAATASCLSWPRSDSRPGPARGLVDPAHELGDRADHVAHDQPQLGVGLDGQGLGRARLGFLPQLAAQLDQQRHAHRDRPGRHQRPPPGRGRGPAPQHGDPVPERDRRHLDQQVGPQPASRRRSSAAPPAVIRGRAGCCSPRRSGLAGAVLHDRVAAAPQRPQVVPVTDLTPVGRCFETTTKTAP
jgi:hypothetical protein